MMNSKYSRFVVAAFSLGLMASCSNDMEVDNGLTTPEESRVACMTINLKDVTNGLGSRADGDEEETPSTDSEYNNGEKYEYAINSARFFFFNENGTYMCEASAWNGSNPDDREHVTLGSNTLVVLENLKKNQGNPKYMLTVINGEGFQPKNDIETTRTTLYHWQNSNNTQEKGQFVMTTSSFFGSTIANHDDTYYYATKLTDDNFVEGQPETGEDGNLSLPEGSEPEVVDVYVERLASKFEVDYSKLGNAITLGDGRKIYKLNATVAGNPNNEGVANEGATDLFVEILGWDVNATAPEAYFSKNIDGFTDTNLWTSWNISGFYRSYWGKGWNYGMDVTLPSVKKDDKGDTVETPGTLNYVNYSLIPNEKYRYSNEYTNLSSTFNNTNGVIAANLTHVVLKARLCDVNGNPLNMVRATNGVLYLLEDTSSADNSVTYTGYLSYVLNQANIKNNLNVWYLVEESGTTTETELEDGSKKVTYSKESKFSQIDQTMVKLELSGEGTGLVKVVPDLPETRGDVTMVYAKRNTDGTYEKFADKAAAAAALKASLDDTNENKGEAMAYTGGASFYPIPIEHNTGVGKDGNDFKEGYYGVVRNHWYKLTINKLLAVGLGVFNPGTGTDNDKGEVIIPKDPKDPSLYVSANLKVLAWKLVSQDVEIE